MFYIIIIICKQTTFSRDAVDSTNYGWHRNFWIAQKSAVKNILTRISDRCSMLHGFPLRPISLKFSPHLHKFERRVLTTCQSAWALPCTTWRSLGGTLLLALFLPSRLRPNFSKFTARRPDSSLLFGSVTKAKENLNW